MGGKQINGDYQREPNVSMDNVVEWQHIDNEKLNPGGAFLPKAARFGALACTKLIIVNGSEHATTDLLCLRQRKAKSRVPKINNKSLYLSYQMSSIPREK